MEKDVISQVNDGGFWAFRFLAVSPACIWMPFTLNALKALNPAPPQIASVNPQVTSLPW